MATTPGTCRSLSLSPRWVLRGHSQGGGAALAVAERERTRPDPGYLGAVVTAPAADLVPTVESIVATPGLGAFLPLVAYGAKVVDPRIRLREVLSVEALRRFAAVHTECLGALFARYAGLTGNGLVRPGYLAEHHFAQFLTANSTGSRPVGGPVLLLQGDADLAIPAAITDRVAASLCRTGSTVDYRTFPGLGHDTIPGVVTGIDDGAADQILAWVTDRFAGRAARSTC